VTERSRRSPKQPRAQATVEAILEAAFQVLEARGAAGLTTNHVAERAGVSIGTLYQYFADKEAILAAMGQRHAEALRERITSILLASPARGRVRAIVQAVLHGIEGSPGTRLALSEALFRTRGEAALSEQHLALLAALDGRREFDFVLGKESAFILTHAVIGLARAAAAEPELELDGAALEDELVLLMESYLAALAARAKRAPAREPSPVD
jgi:AcrR family transcriptional regulator